jgi:hypothetical protein
MLLFPHLPARPARVVFIHPPFGGLSFHENCFVCLGLQVGHEITTNPTVPLRSSQSSSVQIPSESIACKRNSPFPATLGDSTSLNG